MPDTLAGPVPWLLLAAGSSSYDAQSLAKKLRLGNASIFNFLINR